MHIPIMRHTKIARHNMAPVVIPVKRKGGCTVITVLLYDA